MSVDELGFNHDWMADSWGTGAPHSLVQWKMSLECALLKGRAECHGEGLGKSLSYLLRDFRHPVGMSTEDLKICILVGRPWLRMSLVTLPPLGSIISTFGFNYLNVSYETPHQILTRHLLLLQSTAPHTWAVFPDWEKRSSWEYRSGYICSFPSLGRVEDI